MFFIDHMSHNEVILKGKIRRVSYIYLSKKVVYEAKQYLRTIS